MIKWVAQTVRKVYAEGNDIRKRGATIMERTERDTPERFLHEILIMGELMQTCGAEVFRVEDTLARMGKAYGVARMNVFVITSSIVITMELKDGRELTQTRRVRKAGGNDFTRLECLNVLSREYCENPFPAGELGRRLAQIRKIRIPRRERYIGNILAASSFAVFFGGSWKDALISGIFAVAISLLQDYVELICMNTMVFNVIASFLTGYIGRTKSGVEHRQAVKESLEEAAVFASGICGMEGAFGYGKKYE